MINKIKNYTNLDDNWGGYGAKPLTKNVVDDAIKLYETVFKSFEDRLRLHVGASADNEVLFTVRNASDIVICSVFGDGKLHFYAKAGGQKRYFNDVPISDTAPLLAVLKEMEVARQNNKNTSKDIVW